MKIYVLDKEYDIDPGAVRHGMRTVSSLLSDVRKVSEEYGNRPYSVSTVIMMYVLSSAALSRFNEDDIKALCKKQANEAAESE